MTRIVKNYSTPLLLFAGLALLCLGKGLAGGQYFFIRHAMARKAAVTYG